MLTEEEKKEIQIENIKSLTEVLRSVFGEHIESQRFVDVSRIPLICKSIIDTSERLKELKDMLDTKYVMKESFEPIKTFVFGIIGIIGIAILGAILRIVLV